jgi:hypothetical protein
MGFPSPMAFPVLVGIATLTVCSLGVRAEVKIAMNAIAEHRAQAQLAHRAIETQKVNNDELRRGSMAR